MYRYETPSRAASAGIVFAALFAVPIAGSAQTPPRTGADITAPAASTMPAPPDPGYRSTIRTVPIAPPEPAKVVLVFESRERIVEALPPEFQGLLNRLPGGVRPWIYERASLGPIQQISTAAGVSYQLTLTSDEDFGKVRDYYEALVTKSGLSGVTSAERGNGVSIHVRGYRFDLRPADGGATVRLTVVQPD